MACTALCGLIGHLASTRTGTICPRIFAAELHRPHVPCVCVWGHGALYTHARYARFMEVLRGNAGAKRLASMPGLVAGVYDKWDRLQGQGRSRTALAFVVCQRVECVVQLWMSAECPLSIPKKQAPKIVWVPNSERRKAAPAGKVTTWDL